MKAFALISGGLDSTLAAKMIKEQGIEIIALYFKIPVVNNDTNKSCGSHSKISEMAKNLGLEFKIINLTDDFLEIIKNPKYGFGSNMNPCIDCKILMLRRAKELMQRLDAAFIVTGEVLGQRPMSQHKQALYTIAKRAGLEGLVLRPLSAKLLAQTIPEKEGWVDRQKLLSFNGRTRRPQMDLAERFNIKDYSNPAGGCLLTDPQFAKRINDLIEHGVLNLDNIELLKIGRHFRLSANTKLVVGRNEKENERLLNLIKENDYLFMPNQIAGPTALGRGSFNDEVIKLSCRIVCRYCDLDGQISAGIVYKRVPEQDKKLEVMAIENNQLLSFRI